MFNTYMVKPPTFTAIQIDVNAAVVFSHEDSEGNGSFSIFKPDASGENDIEFRHYQPVAVGDYITLDLGSYSHTTQAVFEAKFMLISG